MNWPALMSLGLGHLRLTPDTFWSMTPTELGAAPQRCDWLERSGRRILIGREWPHGLRRMVSLRHRRPHSRSLENPRRCVARHQKSQERQRHMTTHHFHIALAIFDGVAGLVLAFSLISGTVLRFPKWHRFFISIGSAGMLSQSVLLVARSTGFNVEQFWWTWAAKDICIGGLALTCAVMALRGRKIPIEHNPSTSPPSGPHSTA